MSNSSVNQLAQNLGTGLTASLISSINVSSLAGSASSSIGPAVLSLAEGLGNGTSSGLQLGDASTLAQPPVLANGTNLSIADVTGLFGYGLSKSIAQNIKLPNLAATNLTSTLSSLSNSGVFQLVIPASSGFGKGLGQGIPIGLGLQQDTADPTVLTTQGTDLGISTTAQVFAKGFTSQFLANGTISRLTSQLDISSLTPSINIGKGAEGFVRGLVQGVGKGVQSVRSGNLTQASSTQDPPASLLAFNDSVGGAAIGFGYGLGDQGVEVAAQLGYIQMPTSDGDSAIDKRALSESQAAELSSTSKTNEISVVNPRAINLDSINLTALLTAKSISAIAQKGVDDLTCEGVGGMVNVLLGLLSSKTIPSSLLQTGSNSTIDIVKNLLPNGTITLQSGGNQYDVEIQPLNIHINGLSLVKFIVLIILHGMYQFIHSCIVADFLALLLIFVFLLALPLAVTLRSLRSISLLAVHKETLPKSQRWADIIMFWVIPPATILGFGFGIAVTGNAKQFRTGHEVSSFDFYH